MQHIHTQRIVHEKNSSRECLVSSKKNIKGTETEKKCSTFYKQQQHREIHRKKRRFNIKISSAQ